MENQEKRDYLLAQKEDARFEADVVITKEYYRDIGLLWTKGRVICWALIVIVAVWILLLGVLQMEIGLIGLAFVYLLLGAYLLIFLPMIRAKRSFEISVANFGTICHISYFFAEDMIVCENQANGGINSFAYSRIRLLKKTKKAYTLFMEKNLLFYLPFDAMKMEKSAEFEAFLTEKCPNVKNKF